MKGILATGFAGLAIVAGSLLADRASSLPEPAREPTGLDAHETHAAASLLGQFRTSFSAWLWVRADLYLHNGVEMRVLTDEERRKGAQGVGGREQGRDGLHDDGSIVTVVPSAARDFRGPLGDVERATKAYRDMRSHDHNDPLQALPLYRLMVAIDPQFVTAWTVGGMVLARQRNEGGTRLAIDFLGQGLEHNPRSILLRSEIARYYLMRERMPAKAIPYLESAAQIAWETRDRRLPEDEVEAAIDTFRWLAMAYRDTQQPEKSAMIASLGLQLRSDDVVLRRLAMPAPAIFAVEDQDDWYRKVVGVEPPREVTLSARIEPRDRQSEPLAHDEHSHGHGHSHTHGGHSHSH